jgi:hypothetical protein
MPDRKLVNYTRYSSSIPQRLLREKFYLLPLYHLLRTSYLGKEGMDHSGSYSFADHIYRGNARGSLGIGWLLDYALLRLPAARSFRNRYLHSRDRIIELIYAMEPKGCCVLSVPCGIPRDLAEVSAKLNPETLERTRFFGVDADPAALAAARSLVGHLPQFQLICSDTFSPDALPSGQNAITSSGFAEFLDDQELIRFYRLCYEALDPGGLLITSATVRNPFTDFLMRELAELQTHYRDEAHLLSIFQQTPFSRPTFTRDSIGYQILVTAQKEPC